MSDDLITDHAFTGSLTWGASCQYMYETNPPTICGQQAMVHAMAGSTKERHLIHTHPHDFVPQDNEPSLCDYGIDDGVPGELHVCGYPEALHRWAEYDQYMVDTAGKVGVGVADYKGVSEEASRRGKALVRKADVAQYERQPMPDAARKGPVVTLIEAPVDPLGTLAVIGGIYSGRIARSKAEVTDQDRRQMLADMRATVLDGPLESIQFTFLVEGVSRAFTHQAVRNRFSFFAQESLRFAVAEDWAQEVPLPPALSSAGDEDPAVGIWRKAMNQAEDSYAALVGAGMPAEEARGVLPHAITTRYYWTVSLRTLLQEAGKRTCTQAQFDWRIVMGGVAKALRERAGTRRNEELVTDPVPGVPRAWVNHGDDGWQYEAFADLIRPVCYQQGKCGFMAKFDRGCTIRNRVDANERLGRHSSEWGTEYDVVDPSEVVVGVGPKSVVVDQQDVPLFIGAIDPAEWAADPSAARVKGE